ncbi:hypothetical protein BJ322DRAFT_1018326 [Thelephora terrestris]|uniref:Uncharacterized protein n=1 Tax=Thelephora terrestris TaxID=56493 RepID=A0A9P6HMT8_9AGAM|nr:hypothetical protein BJ322DRAFT_1018326 [Thelephora terrestris]
MHAAYWCCVSAWGPDERWLNPETRHESIFGIYEYDMGVGSVVEITLYDAPKFGILEIDAERFQDPHFEITDVIDPDANTVGISVREGGFWDCKKKYVSWEWPALAWLRKLVKDQLEFEKSEETISVQRTFIGYGLHIEGTDIHFEITHPEVLGDALNIGRILRIMRSVRDVDIRGRSPLFWDCRLNKRQRRITGTLKLSARISHDGYQSPS